MDDFDHNPDYNINRLQGRYTDREKRQMTMLILEMLQEQGKLCGGDENVDPFMKEYVSIIITVICQAMECQCYM